MIQKWGLFFFSEILLLTPMFFLRDLSLKSLCFHEKRSGGGGGWDSAVSKKYCSQLKIILADVF